MLKLFQHITLKLIWQGNETGELNNLSYIDRIARHYTE